MDVLHESRSNAAFLSFAFSKNKFHGILVMRLYFILIFNRVKGASP